MSDDRRVYSDDEFALILRKAAELASGVETPARSSAGLTLADMKAAAAQVGLDPALVERAARLLPVTTTASAFERLIGGPMQHEQMAHFPITLDENTAARLLSAVRISAGPSGSGVAGHSSAMGMTWQSGGETEPFSVTARVEQGGTTLSVIVDRRITLGLVAMFSGVAMFFTLLFAGSVLYRVAPALGFAGLIAGVGGTLAVARGFWASTTQKVRERVSVVMDAIGQTLTREETQPSGLPAVGDGTATPEPPSHVVPPTM